MTFTALDFETAQGPRWSVCQVGIVRVEAGEITHEDCQLVQPPGNCYWSRWSGIHGITARDTRNAPTFAEYWPRIEPFITGQLVVAHNAAFDVSCLKQALSLYGITCPPFETRCTYKHFKKGLAEICAEQGIPLNHHDALSDARACARLALLASLPFGDPFLVHESMPAHLVGLDRALPL